MDCSAFQAELPDLIYGELDPEVRPAVDAHLKDCASCAGLTEELRAVRNSLPVVEMPPILGARIQLQARDVLLEERGPPPLRGSALHVAAAALLGLALVVVGFGLGIAWERNDAPPPPGLVLPEDPSRLPIDPSPIPGEPPERPGGTRPETPRAPDAWQRVLHDAGRSALAKGKAAEAREFFRRAEAVNRDGPLAIPCRLGAAEAAIRMGSRDDARELLRATRATLATGDIPNGAALLERVQALEQELGE